MARRKPTAPPPVSVSMEASRWKFISGPEFNYSNVNMPPSPEQVVSTTFRYSVPLDPGKVGYLLCPHTAPITAGGIACELELSGDGVVVDAKEPWGAICTMRFILYRDLSTARGRWWCKAGIDLNASKNLGVLTLAAPFTLDQWTSVMGEKASDYPADFAACLNGPTNLGFTHGAADAGHGLKLSSGALAVTVRDFRLSA